MNVGWLILMANLKGFRIRNEVNLWVCLGGRFQGGQAESERLSLNGEAPSTSTGRGC